MAGGSKGPPILFIMRTPRELYDSPAWKRKRALILRRDGYRCQECKRYGRMRQADTVHHIYPYELYPERALSSWNLISLCNACHNAMHDRDTHELTQAGLALQDRVARAREAAGDSPRS